MHRSHLRAHGPHRIRAPGAMGGLAGRLAAGVEPPDGRRRTALAPAPRPVARGTAARAVAATRSRTIRPTGNGRLRTGRSRTAPLSLARASAMGGRCDSGGRVVELLHQAAPDGVYWKQGGGAVVMAQAHFPLGGELPAPSPSPEPTCRPRSFAAAGNKAGNNKPICRPSAER